MNRYTISRSIDNEHWVEVGTWDARSFREAILKAKQRDKASDVWWRSVIVGNKSGRKLGKSKTFDWRKT